MVREAIQRPGKPARANARANARAARSPRRNRRPLALLVLALVVVGVAVGAYVVRGQSPESGAGVRPLATLSTADFHALAFSPDNPDTAFFGHHNGIMRTED